MPGSITPLPIMLEEEDRKVYEALEPPKSIVIRYGYMKFVAELPYDGSAKPGCGSKLVVRTHRGIELGEMLTTTCGNGGCSKSVSRKQMLQYIENSGGKDYPFSTQGKVLRVATVEDMQEQQRLDSRKMAILQQTRAMVRETDLQMRVVDVEPLLGGERIIFHYTAEQWVDFRELVRRLAAEFQTRIEMHQVNARDEARIVADYEKCGQHCCCKQFLKVLKPVSMRSAKVQKATLDPTKISGRCGRLMCCLRYEDETYESLRRRLPHRQTRVMTADGPGTVVDTQILTQLVMVLLDPPGAQAAYPLENIHVMSKEEQAAHPVPRPPQLDDRRGGPAGPPDRRGPRPERGPEHNPDRGPRQDRPSGAAQGPISGTGAEGSRPVPPPPRQEPRIEAGPPVNDQAAPVGPMGGESDEGDDDGPDDSPMVESGSDEPSGPMGPTGSSGPADSQGQSGQPGQPGDGQRRRRRRRRRRRGGGRGPEGGAPPQGGGGPPAV